MRKNEILKCRNYQAGKSVKISVIGVFILLLLGITVWSAPPQTLNYQGNLTDASGKTLSGTYSIIFTLYDSLTEGAQLWTETHEAVEVKDGHFNAQLGSVSPFTMNFKDQYFLEIKVGEETLSPRLPFNSVPYALQSASESSVTKAKQLIQELTVAEGESITAGDVVALVNGKLKKQNCIPGMTTTNEIKQPEGDYWISSIGILDSSRFILVGNDGFIIGTIKDGQISYGAVNAYPELEYCRDASDIIVLDSSHFVIAITYRTREYEAAMVVGTISGDSVTFGNKAVIVSPGEEKMWFPLAISRSSLGWRSNLAENRIEAFEAVSASLAATGNAKLPVWSKRFLSSPLPSVMKVLFSLISAVSPKVR